MQRTIRVIGPDGALLGTLSHVVSERGGGRPTGLVISRNGDERVVPLSAVEGSSGTIVQVRLRPDEVAGLPPFLRTAYRVIDEEMEMRAELDEDFQVGYEEDDEDAAGQGAGFVGASS